MTETPVSRPSHRCPRCNSRVKRVLRSANDKRRWDADNWRRYRCRSEHCDWQGLQAVSPHRHSSADRRSAGPVLVRAGRTLLVLLLAGGLSWLGIQLLQYLMQA